MSAPLPRQLRAGTAKSTLPAVIVAETIPPVSVIAVSLSVALIFSEPSTPESLTGP
jgi:hypothetical protein